MIEDDEEYEEVEEDEEDEALHKESLQAITGLEGQSHQSSQQSYLQGSVQYQYQFSHFTCYKVSITPHPTPPSSLSLSNIPCIAGLFY